MRPLVPYAGSSRKTAKLIATMLRQEGPGDYSEPMVGGGSVFFELMPTLGRINDIEPLMANLYSVVRDRPEQMIGHLETYDPTREVFDDFLATIRDCDDGIEQAARWYFLLILCYNGVVKQKGGNPYLTFGDRYETWHQRWQGRRGHIRAAHWALQGIMITCGDYQSVPVTSTAFFDPPWFGSAEDYGVQFDHQRLADYLKDYYGKWVLTINECDEAYDIYTPISYWGKNLSPYYSVAPVEHGRGKRSEILLTNFEPRMFGG